MPEFAVNKVYCVMKIKLGSFTFCWSEHFEHCIIYYKCITTFFKIVEKKKTIKFYLILFSNGLFNFNKWFLKKRSIPYFIFPKFLFCCYIPWSKLFLTWKIKEKLPIMAITCILIRHNFNNFELLSVMKYGSRNVENLKNNLSIVISSFYECLQFGLLFVTRFQQTMKS